MTPIVIRPNRFTHLILIPPALVLMGVAAYVLLVKAEEEFLETTWYVVCAGILLAGCFFMFMSLRSFFQNKFLFRVSEEGIESNDGGIGTGLIRWEEIRQVQELMMPNSFGDPKPALGLYLYNPRNFQAAYNPLLASLMEANRNIQGGDKVAPTLVLSPGTLGKHYAAVRKAMEERLRHQIGSLPDQEPVMPRDAENNTRSTAGLLQHLLAVRSGRSKPDYRVYLFVALFALCAAVDLFANDTPVSATLVFFLGFLLLLILELFRIGKQRN